MSSVGFFNSVSQNVGTASVTGTTSEAAIDVLSWTVPEGLLNSTGSGAYTVVVSFTHAVSGLDAVNIAGAPSDDVMIGSIPSGASSSYNIPITISNDVSGSFSLVVNENSVSESGNTDVIGPPVKRYSPSMTYNTKTPITAAPISFRMEECTTQTIGLSAYTDLSEASTAVSVEMIPKTVDGTTYNMTATVLSTGDNAGINIAIRFTAPEGFDETLEFTGTYTVSVGMGTSLQQATGVISITATPRIIDLAGLALTMDEDSEASVSLSFYTNADLPNSTITYSIPNVTDPTDSTKSFSVTASTTGTGNGKQATFISVGNIESKTVFEGTYTVRQTSQVADAEGNNQPKITTKTSAVVITVVPDPGGGGGGGEDEDGVSIDDLNYIPVDPISFSLDEGTAESITLNSYTDADLSDTAFLTNVTLVPITDDGETYRVSTTPTGTGLDRKVKFTAPIVDKSRVFSGGFTVTKSSTGMGSGSQDKLGSAGVTITVTNIPDPQGETGTLSVDAVPVVLNESNIRVVSVGVNIEGDYELATLTTSNNSGEDDGLVLAADKDTLMLTVTAPIVDDHKNYTASLDATASHTDPDSTADDLEASGMIYVNVINLSDDGETEGKLSIDDITFVIHEGLVKHVGISVEIEGDYELTSLMIAEDSNSGEADGLGLGVDLDGRTLTITAPTVDAHKNYTATLEGIASHTDTDSTADDLDASASIDVNVINLDLIGPVIQDIPIVYLYTIAAAGDFDGRADTDVIDLSNFIDNIYADDDTVDEGNTISKVDTLADGITAVFNSTKSSVTITADTTIVEETTSHFELQAVNLGGTAKKVVNIVASPSIPGTLTVDPINYRDITETFRGREPISVRTTGNVVVTGMTVVNEMPSDALSFTFLNAAGASTTTVSEYASLRITSMAVDEDTTYSATLRVTAVEAFDGGLMNSLSEDGAISITVLDNVILEVESITGTPFMAGTITGLSTSGVITINLSHEITGPPQLYISNINGSDVEASEIILGTITPAGAAQSYMLQNISWPDGKETTSFQLRIDANTLTTELMRDGVPADVGPTTTELSSSISFNTEVPPPVWSDITGVTIDLSDDATSNDTATLNLAPFLMKAAAGTPAAVLAQLTTVVEIGGFDVGTISKNSAQIPILTITPTDGAITEEQTYQVQLTAYNTRSSSGTTVDSDHISESVDITIIPETEDAITATWSTPSGTVMAETTTATVTFSENVKAPPSIIVNDDRNVYVSDVSPEGSSTRYVLTLQLPPSNIGEFTLSVPKNSVTSSENDMKTGPADIVTSDEISYNSYPDVSWQDIQRRIITEGSVMPSISLEDYVTGANQVTITDITIESTENEDENDQMTETQMAQGPDVTNFAFLEGEGVDGSNSKIGTGESVVVFNVAPNLPMGLDLNLNVNMTANNTLVPGLPGIPQVIPVTIKPMVAQSEVLDVLSWGGVVFDDVINNTSSSTDGLIKRDGTIILSHPAAANAFDSILFVPTGSSILSIVGVSVTTPTPVSSNSDPTDEFGFTVTIPANRTTTRFRLRVPVRTIPAANPAVETGPPVNRDSPLIIFNTEKLIELIPINSTIFQRSSATIPLRRTEFDPSSNYHIVPLYEDVRIHAVRIPAATITDSASTVSTDITFTPNSSNTTLTITSTEDVTIPDGQDYVYYSAIMEVDWFANPNNNLTYATANVKGTQKTSIYVNVVRRDVIEAVGLRSINVELAIGTSTSVALDAYIDLIITGAAITTITTPTNITGTDTNDMTVDLVEFSVSTSPSGTRRLEVTATDNIVIPDGQDFVSYDGQDMTVNWELNDQADSDELQVFVTVTPAVEELQTPDYIDVSRWDGTDEFITATSHTIQVLFTHPVKTMPMQTIPEIRVSGRNDITIDRIIPTPNSNDTGFTIDVTLPANQPTDYFSLVVVKDTVIPELPTVNSGPLADRISPSITFNTSDLIRLSPLNINIVEKSILRTSLGDSLQIFDPNITVTDVTIHSLNLLDDATSTPVTDEMGRALDADGNVIENGEVPFDYDYDDETDVITVTSNTSITDSRATDVYYIGKLKVTYTLSGVENTIESDAYITLINLDEIEIEPVEGINIKWDVDTDGIIAGPYKIHVELESPEFDISEETGKDIEQQVTDSIRFDGVPLTSSVEIAESGTDIAGYIGDFETDELAAEFLSNIETDDSSTDNVFSNKFYWNTMENVFKWGGTVEDNEMREDDDVSWSSVTERNSNSIDETTTPTNIDGSNFISETAQQVNDTDPDMSVMQNFEFTDIEENEDEEIEGMAAQDILRENFLDGSDEEGLSEIASGLSARTATYIVRINDETRLVTGYKDKLRFSVSDFSHNQNTTTFTINVIPPLLFHGTATPYIEGRDFIFVKEIVEDDPPVDPPVDPPTDPPTDPPSNGSDSDGN